MTTQTGSPPKKLAKADYISILKGAGIAAVGGVIVYLADKVVPSLREDYGDTLLFVVASTTVNAIRKWLVDTRSNAFLWAVLLCLCLSGSAVHAETPQPPKQILLLRPALIGPFRVKGRSIPVQQVAPDTYMAPRPKWHYVVDPLGLFR